jgi:transposase
MVEDFFKSLLRFPEYWEVEKIEYDASTKEVDIYIKFHTENYKEEHSESYFGVHDYQGYRRWRHLDILEYKTFIKAKLPRLIGEDGKVTTLAIPWARLIDRHSYLFESKVIDTLLATKNQTKTASLLRCSFSLVNRIIHNATERGLERRDKDIRYRQLSLDEKAFKKGHQYVSVLSNPENGTIIDVSEGRTKSSCKLLLDNNLSSHQKSNVEQISVDMWKAYSVVIKEELPNSKIVHDRFHLIQYLNKAVDKVRRREVKTIEALKNSRYPLLKNQENLTMKQHFKFEEVLQLNTAVSFAWRLKESFKGLFDCENYQEAYNRYSEWSSFCRWEDIPEISKVAKMFGEHIVGVCNALVEKLSNAMAERLNGKIQELKTIGKGFRTFEKFRSVILFFNGGLNLYPHQTW